VGDETGEGGSVMAPPGKRGGREPPLTDLSLRKEKFPASRTTVEAEVS